MAIPLLPILGAAFAHGYPWWKKRQETKRKGSAIEGMLAPRDDMQPPLPKHQQELLDHARFLREGEGETEAFDYLAKNKGPRATLDARQVASRGYVTDVTGRMRNSLTGELAFPDVTPEQIERTASSKQHADVLKHQYWMSLSKEGQSDFAELMALGRAADVKRLPDGTYAIHKRDGTLHRYQSAEEALESVFGIAAAKRAGTESERVDLLEEAGGGTSTITGGVPESRKEIISDEEAAEGAETLAAAKQRGKESETVRVLKTGAGATGTYTGADPRTLQELTTEEDTLRGKEAAAQAAGEGAATGKVIAKFKTGLPMMAGLVQRASDMTRNIQEHRAYKTLIGSGRWIKGGVLKQFFPGKDEAALKARIEQFSGNVRTMAYESLKGGGHLTEAESQFAAQGLSRTISTSQSPAEFDAALRSFNALLKYNYDAASRAARGDFSVQDIKRDFPQLDFAPEDLKDAAETDTGRTADDFEEGEELTTWRRNEKTGVLERVQ